MDEKKENSSGKKRQGSIILNFEFKNFEFKILNSKFNNGYILSGKAI